MTQGLIPEEYESLVTRPLSDNGYCMCSFIVKLETEGPRNRQVDTRCQVHPSLTPGRRGRKTSFWVSASVTSIIVVNPLSSCLGGVVCEQTSESMVLCPFYKVVHCVWCDVMWSVILQINLSIRRFPFFGTRSLKCPGGSCSLKFSGILDMTYVNL